jgi:replicative DNA helicase Mcm
MKKKENKTAEELFAKKLELSKKWAEIIEPQLATQNKSDIPIIYIDLQTIDTDENKYLVDCLFNKTKFTLDIIKEETGKQGFEKDAFLVLTKNDANSQRIEKSLKRIRDFRASDIGKLVVFKGLIRNSTGIIPKLKLAALLCTACNQEMLTYSLQDGDNLDITNVRCQNCRENKFIVKDEDSVFVDFMKCQIEESPEGLKEKQQERINCEIMEPLTNEEYRVNVGERVTIAGIFRARRKSNTSLIYEPYVQVIGIFKNNKSFEDYIPSEEDEKKFIEMSKDKNLIMKLSKTLAPNIFGMNVEKTAFVLQMFGGNLYSKERRGEIHILLTGDPSVAKSQIIHAIQEVAPHVVMASGAPTSTVGLTACVRKDEDSPGGFVLEAGAAVLADNGILIIDEFDKMNKEVRGALHEIMEDRRTTISKANINTTMNTRVSVVAVMNPKKNRFNDEESVSEQIDLPPSLLSRFDLIFAIRDTVDEEKDRRICDAVFKARQGIITDTEYTKEDLTKYIIYAKSKIKEITFSEEAQKILTEKYIKMRSINENKEAISITARQLEGMARLAEAFAKSRLSTVVEAQDAMMATEMLDYFMNTIFYDEKTKSYDADKAYGQETTYQKNTRDSIVEYIQKNYDELTKNTVGGKIPVIELKKKFIEETKISEKDYEKAFNSGLGDSYFYRGEEKEYISLSASAMAGVVSSCNKQVRGLIND